MKKKIFKPLVFLALIFAACNNNKESSGDKKETIAKDSAKNNTVSAENLISFKVNKELVVSPIFNILRFDFHNGLGTSLNLSITTSNDQHKTITFNVNGVKPGSYPLGSNSKTTKTSGVAYGSYSPDFQKVDQSQYNFTKGEFVITSIDTTAGLLNATFHGTAKTIKGDSVLITEGNVINGKLNPGITKF